MHKHDVVADFIAALKMAWRFVLLFIVIVRTLSIIIR